MLNFISKLLDSNSREVNSFQPVISKINSLEEEFKKLKDKDFAKKTSEYRQRIADGESLESILPEAFALTREAGRRTLSLRHFDVQLIAAMALARGKIAEQKTGEGKTLSAVPALYLHSLTGKGVHLVTVNDYLARRDAGWMGPIFNLLGVSVSSIINNQSFIYDTDHIESEVVDFRLKHLRPVSRREAYMADITYGINSEFGFDYLRDNMAPDLENVVQRGYYFAIVDEVDSVLIDEARTPHIISAPDEAPSQKYYEYAKVIEKLTPELDYKIDEKHRTSHLTDHGISKIEKLYGIADIYEKDFDTVYHLEAALKARSLFQREKDYIVKDGEVILVDEFTGRLMEGRRLSEGIHQAIEAKENVAIQRESKTLATVSLQNYFRMYERLSGMTGTAVTEAEEFRKIYKLDVVVIPTNVQVKRLDASDAVYKSSRAKYSAVAAEIEAAHKKGQPILVGTTSIEKNEIISQLLKRKGIKHELLNAKNHQKEAQIISKAGLKGAVTIATNMAGRGVDIVLGGETPKHSDGRPKTGTPEWIAWEKAHKEVLKLGGLYVIGTERHESRRIDNQLRGRAGRQGDPGASKFFVALNDEIMRLFGGDRIAGIMTRFNMPEDVPLQHPLVTKSIENAQVKVEGFNFDSRKYLVQYDDVLNKQREIIYRMRRSILEKSANNDETLKDEVQSRLRQAISNLVTVAVNQPFFEPASINEKIADDFSTIIPFDDSSKKQLVTQLRQRESIEEKIEFLNSINEDLYRKREDSGKNLTRQIEKMVMLSVIDNLWMSHLDAVENLRQGIGLRGYAQKDPLVEYKNEGYRMFEQLMGAIDDEIVHRIYKVQIQHEHSIQHTHTHAVTNTPASEVSGAVNSGSQTAGDRILRPLDGKSEKGSSAKQGETKAKPGRNDPCWCGSGKKFKKCHLNREPHS
jgi:preprotein translocase subunit SecA